MLSRSRARAAGPALLVALALGVFAPAASGQTIRGTLLQEGSDAPINLGLVVMLTQAGDSVGAALTNERGEFSLTSPEPGSFLLHAAAFGHHQRTAGIFELGENAEMTVEFRLAIQVFELEGLEIIADQITEPQLVRNGFYSRLQRGLGHFITPEDLENTMALQTQDLFYRMGRVRVVYGGITGDRVVMRGPNGTCSPRVYVDGHRMSLSGTSLNHIVPLHALAAVEVYRGAAEIPIEYSGIGLDLCGAIVFWTK